MSMLVIGLVTTLAGSAGVLDYADGQGTLARFTYPGGLALSSDGLMYVADSGNNRIRVVTTAGM